MKKMNFHRSQMLVFSVQMSYDKKKSYISLETLCVLSRVNFLYLMPPRVPLTHLTADDSHDSDPGGRKVPVARRPPVRVHHVPSAVVAERRVERWLSRCKRLDLRRVAAEGLRYESVQELHQRHQQERCQVGAHTEPAAHEQPDP
jgi:hypothetical protein